MVLGISVSALNAAMCDSEQDLVERAKRDGEAFAALYRAHRQAIARYIYRRVGDVHATEDLVADVFMIALQSLPRFRSRGVPIRAWFYRIATNRVNRWARRERGRVLKQLDAEPADPKSGSSQTRLRRTSGARNAFFPPTASNGSAPTRRRSSWLRTKASRSKAPASTDRSIWTL